MAKQTVTVQCGPMDRLSRLLGIYDENLNVVTKELGVVAYTENTEIKISGEEEKVVLAKTVPM